MPARSGKAFLEGLSAPRNIWMNGERVSDIVDHPALSGAAHSIAEVYDLQLKYSDVCLGTDPDTKDNINLAHIIPRSKGALLNRHKCLEKIAQFSVGLMGRTPDYLNLTFAGFSGDRSTWATHGNEEGAENLAAYQRQLSHADWALTHAIVSPSSDKSGVDPRHKAEHVAVHKVEDTENGILIRGSKALATLAPFADEISVYPRTPMPIGTEDFMLAFAVPISTPGLKFLCRDSMSMERNDFDHPFSGRFDEQDAFVIFDDVEVPRERVFIDGNVDVYNSVMTKTWMPNIMQQTMIRAQVKLSFAWALGRRMAKVINDNSEATQKMLGEIWCYAEFARSAIANSETEAVAHRDNFWTPSAQPLYALRCMLPFWFPKVSEYLKLIGSHYMFSAPRAANMKDPEMKHLIDLYLGGAADVTAEDRAQVFRLSWDFVGTEMAGRNEQYERFYLGSGSRNLQNVLRVAKTAESDGLVDQFL